MIDSIIRLHVKDAPLRGERVNLIFEWRTRLPFKLNREDLIDYQYLSKHTTQYITKNTIEQEVVNLHEQEVNDILIIDNFFMVDGVRLTAEGVLYRLDEPEDLYMHHQDVLGETRTNKNPAYKE